MRQLIPPFILQNFRLGKYHGTFVAAGLFLDISGFSKITDVLMQHGQHGAEVLAGLMSSVFDPLVSSIYSQGGIIVGFAGDAITALFPVEASDGEDEPGAARRALAAAWIIQQNLAEHPTINTVYSAFPISAKIGLSYGQVDWGILRSRDERKATYYFRGAAVDDAASAEHMASSGEVLLSAQMATLLQEFALLQDRNEYSLVTGLTGGQPPRRDLPPTDEDLETATYFLPELVLSQNVTGEFRQAVNLFIQIPDIPNEHLGEFIATLFDLQERFGGLLSRLDFGDKGCNMILFWGAPVAFENDIGRALNLVLELQNRAEFPFNAGVTYYIAHAGYMGSALFEDYTCYGWGINLAARFMISAPAGEIWVDERVARRVGRRFEIEYVGEQSFKGFANEQKVYRLIGRKNDTELPYQGEMVGREREMEHLTKFATPLWQAQPAGVLVVWGDAGIGKSRLVHEFLGSLALKRRAFTTALCQTDQIYQQSFNPFRYWLSRYFEIPFGLNTISARQIFDDKLDALIANTLEHGLAHELDHTRSALGALLELHWENSLYEKLDAESRYDLTVLALTNLIKAESMQQPVILFIEDAQFIDEDSRKLLLFIKRSLKADRKGYPVALIASSRRQGYVLNYEDFADTSIDLHGISATSLAQLAENILGGAVSPDLVKVLALRSEGNPYFAEQILRYLQEENLLEPSGFGWKIAGDWHESVLPADINAILVARLDQLSREVREIIQTASILGREFELRILAHMLGDQNKITNQIAQAEQAAIWSPISQIRYLFSHGLLRDAAYSMQVQARRQELHLLALQSLENLYGDTDRAHFSELAFHSEQANLNEKACRYLEMAGNAAREAYQNQSALNYYGRALKFSQENDAHTHFRLRLKREKILADFGKVEEDDKELKALNELARSIGEDDCLAETAIRTSKFVSSAGNYARAVELASEAIRLASNAKNGLLAVSAYNDLCDCLMHQGLYQEAVVEAEAGLKLARDLGSSRDEGLLLNTLGQVYIEMKNPATAIGFFEESLSILSNSGELRLAAMPLNNLGNAFGYMGNFKAAQDCLEQSLQLAREVGSRKGEALVLSNLGWLTAMQGNYYVARTYTERTLQIARETGDALAETFGLINLSGQEAAVGDFEVALESAYTALKLAHKSNDRNAEAWAHTYLGHCLLETGQAAEAVEAYQSAVDTRLMLGQTILEIEPRAGLAKAALDIGQRPRAKACAELVAHYLLSGGSLDGTDEPVRIYWFCYNVLKAMDDPRAETLLSSAHDLLLQRAKGIEDEQIREMFLGNVTYNRQLLDEWQISH